MYLEVSPKFVWDFARFLVFFDPAVELPAGCNPDPIWSFGKLERCSVLLVRNLVFKMSGIMLHTVEEVLHVYSL